MESSRHVAYGDDDTDDEEAFHGAEQTGHLYLSPTPKIVVVRTAAGRGYATGHTYSATRAPGSFRMFHVREAIQGLEVHSALGAICL